MELTPDELKALTESPEVYRLLAQWHLLQLTLGASDIRAYCQYDDTNEHKLRAKELYAYADTLEEGAYGDE
jgi:hypothetical protein